MTIWIPNRHVINGLEGMVLLNKVVQDVPQQYLFIRVATVQDGNLHIVIGVTQGSMKFTINNEHSHVIRLCFCHFSPNVSQFIFPFLPELSV